jgi:hypothetical protein
MSQQLHRWRQTTDETFGQKAKPVGSRGILSVQVYRGIQC